MKSYSLSREESIQYSKIEKSRSEYRIPYTGCFNKIAKTYASVSSYTMIV
jgi:hypothetical protein